MAFINENEEAYVELLTDVAACLFNEGNIVLVKYGVNNPPNHHIATALIGGGVPPFKLLG